MSTEGLNAATLKGTAWLLFFASCNASVGHGALRATAFATIRHTLFECCANHLNIPIADVTKSMFNSLVPRLATAYIIAVYDAFDLNERVNIDEANASDYLGRHATAATQWHIRHRERPAILGSAQIGTKSSRRFSFSATLATRRTLDAEGRHRSCPTIDRNDLLHGNAMHHALHLRCNHGLRDLGGHPPNLGQRCGHYPTSSTFDRGGYHTTNSHTMVALSHIGRGVCKHLVLAPQTCSPLPTHRLKPLSEVGEQDLFPRHVRNHHLHGINHNI